MSTRLLAGALDALWWAPAVLFVVLVGLASLETDAEVVAAWSVAFLLCTGWLVSIVVWLPKHQAVIPRARAADRPTFWRRNRDVWLVLLGGVVGSALSAVTGYVLGSR